MELVFRTIYIWSLASISPDHKERDSRVWFGMRKRLQYDLIRTEELGYRLNKMFCSMVALPRG